MIEVETGVDSAVDLESLEILRACTGINCVPSPTKVEELQDADIILMSGQIVGAGKSTFIQNAETSGRINIPSWTNRDLRPGEVEGVDKIHASLSELAKRALDGYFLEIEEVRPKVFYATPAEFTSGKSYVKDLELKGALRLRTYAPELPIVVPLPPINNTEPYKVTEWEQRVVKREDLNKSVTDKAYVDLSGRLNGVVEETTRILETGLIDDPHTLLVINDSLPDALKIMHHFLATGEAIQPPSLASHIQKLKQLALVALVAQDEQST